MNLQERLSDLGWEICEVDGGFCCMEYNPKVRRVSGTFAATNGECDDRTFKAADVAIGYYQGRELDKINQPATWRGISHRRIL